MKTILCGYDFSEASKTALHHACRLADFFNSRLMLVHIYNVPVPVTEFGYVDVSDEVIKKNAIKELNELRGELLKTHTKLNSIDVVVETGLIQHKLHKIAEEQKADLIVMGIDNEGGVLKESLLGSTAITEAREYKTPVLIVPKNCENRKFNTIAYACDYKQNYINSTALIQVKYLTTIFNAKLNVVHVLPPEHELNEAEATNDKYIEHKLENVDHRTFFVYEKDAASGIIEFVNQHQIDMIIVEPHKYNFAEKLFHKSTTKHLAFHVNRPILTIHGS